MLETIAVSILTAVGKKVCDSATSKATGQASDALLSKLKGDPTKKAFKRALGEAVQRYAVGERLYLAAPLLEDDQGILARSDVAKELSCLIGFERQPNARLIGEQWKAAVLAAPNTTDFTKEAQFLLSYLEQSLRASDVFRPVFEAKSLEAIAATTAISDETLEFHDRTTGAHFRRTLGTGESYCGHNGWPACHLGFV